MRKFWAIARHEYLKITRKRSFVIGTLATPLTLFGVMAVGIFFVLVSSDRRPVGYVDQAGLVSETGGALEAARRDHSVELRGFPDEAAARAALQDGAIQAYYVLPSDYLTSHQAQLYYWEKPPVLAVQMDFDYFVRANLATSLPADVARRARQGVVMTVRSADGQQEISARGIVNLFAPFFLGMFLSIVIVGSGGYLLEAVTDEKENRTIEVMTTSVTPGQLIGGKALGLIAVALTQVAILSIAIALAVIVGSYFLEPLRELRIPWSMLLTLAIFFVPTFALIAGMMIAVGSMVSEARQGQQISGALSMLFTLPFFFLFVFFSAPNSTLATLLTIFPTTALLTIALRWSMTTIPTWELIAAWVSVSMSGLIMVWMAARIFRLGMLNYGQRLDGKSVWRAVRFGADG